jgi:hypothetical protein
MVPVQPVNSCSNLIEGYLAGTFEWPPCELKIFNANSRHREMRIPRQSFDKYSEYRCLVSLFFILFPLFFKSVHCHKSLESITSTKREKTNKKVILIG